MVRVIRSLNKLVHIAKYMYMNESKCVYSSRTPVSLNTSQNARAFLAHLLFMPRAARPTHDSTTVAY